MTAPGNSRQSGQSGASGEDFPPRSGANLSVSSGEIHLWAVALDPAPEVVERLTRGIAPDEWERARRFRFERHRRRYLVGRGALRALLGGYLGIAPGEVAFSYGPRGKPFLAGRLATASGLSFNLSNSYELALVGFLRGPEIGVDVEFLKPMPDLEQIAERFFSESERAALRRLPAPQRPEGFFNCWTRKEAYLKAVGEGLAAPLDSFAVTLAPGEAPRMLTLKGDAERAARWFFRCFRPERDYIGALAVDGIAGGEEPAAATEAAAGASGAWRVKTFRFRPDDLADSR
ncbi:MAG TPA: 4'-phosphopantetheinyl transferase superfamily protein [Thermoanaerobaculia bacterium]|nr:4'-phosphopantetheinyl transferase superfamily protein [Thermoanaerobaculia bacterium]